MPVRRRAARHRAAERGYPRDCRTRDCDRRRPDEPAWRPCFAFRAGVGTLSGRCGFASAGPWRLLEAQQSFDARGRSKCCPKHLRRARAWKKKIGAEVRLLDQLQRSRQHGAGTEFESLHPFRLGDDPRRIDWRATARQQSLVVRHFQIERHRDVMIIIDSGRLMGADVGRGSKLDCAVDAALNLARVVLQSGDRCGVAAYDREVRGFLPPLAGVSALRSMAECVYDLQTQWHESDFTPMLGRAAAAAGEADVSDRSLRPERCGNVAADVRVAHSTAAAAPGAVRRAADAAAGADRAGADRRCAGRIPESGGFPAACATVGGHFTRFLITACTWSTSSRRS